MYCSIAYTELNCKYTKPEINKIIIIYNYYSINIQYDNFYLNIN